ncbi:MAG: hypothetical protein ACK6CU_21330 [Deltaproteobacteria bacterium]
MAARWCSRVWQVAIVVAATGASTRAALADDLRIAERFEVPPPPDEAEPWWELELGALAVAPIERSAVCPAGRDCVMNAGIGLGLRFMRRQPDRVGWGFAYDLWVLDSASLYEIALLHALRGQVRYVLDETSRVQPWIGAGVGALLFGDASRVATGGGLLSGGLGAHFEITSDFALLGSAEAWLFAMAPFSTRDATPRGEPFGVNVVLEVMVGAVVRIGALERD